MLGVLVAIYFITLYRIKAVIRTLDGEPYRNWNIPIKEFRQIIKDEKDNHLKTKYKRMLISFWLALSACILYSAVYFLFVVGEPNGCFG